MPYFTSWCRNDGSRAVATKPQQRRTHAQVPKAHAFCFLPTNGHLPIALLPAAVQAMPGDANEGELSVAKAQVVRNVRLARLGRSKPLLLQYQLRMHPFDNCLWTPNGCNSVLGLFDNGPQTTFKGKRLADGIEALIGAFYLSGAAAEAAQNTAAAAAAGSARNRPAAGQDSEIYGVEEPSVPAMLDAASWVWHRVSQPGLEAAAALCEVLEVLPQGEPGPTAASQQWSLSVVPLSLCYTAS